MEWNSHEFVFFCPIEQSGLEVQSLWLMFFFLWFVILEGIFLFLMKTGAITSREFFRYIVYPLVRPKYFGIIIASSW